MRARDLRGLLFAGVVVLSVGCDESSDLPSDATAGGSEGGGTTTGSTSGGDETTAPMLRPKMCGELIDDMESGTNLILQEGGRQGAWYLYNDLTETGVQMPEGPFVPTAGGAPNSDNTVPETLYSARTSGTGFTEWGAGIGFNINDVGCAMVDEEGVCIDEPPIPMLYDVSAYTGVSFYTRYWGDLAGAPVVFKIVTEGVTLVADGGTCVVPAEGEDPGQCEIAHEARATAYKDTWTPYEIAFEDLIQPTVAGSNALDFDPTKVRAFQFQVNQSFPEFDFAVDEVCFF